MLSIKSIFTYSCLALFSFHLTAIDFEELFPELSDILGPKNTASGSPRSPKLSGSKRLPEPQEREPKRLKTDEEALLEGIIGAEFAEHQEILLPLLALSYDNKTLPEYIKSISLNGGKNWMIISLAFYLKYKDIDFSISSKFIEKIRHPKKRIYGVNKNALNKAFESFRELNSENNPFIFTSTFAEIMENYFIPLLEKDLSKEEIDSIQEKLGYLKSVRRDKIYDSKKASLVKSGLKEELWAEISNEYLAIGQWVLEEKIDDTSKVALLSLLTKAKLMDSLKKEADTLKSSSICAAFCVYLMTLEVPSDVIRNFVLKARNNKGTLAPSSPENMWKVYTKLNVAQEKIPLWYKRPTFVRTLVELEPLLKRISLGENIQYANQEMFAKLKEDCIMPVENNEIYIISDAIYNDLLNKPTKNTKIVNYINNLSLNNSQKAALLSIVHGVDETDENLVDAIKSLFNSLHAQPLAIAICIYLRHFDVPSEEISAFLFFVKDLYLERSSFGKRSAQTYFKQFKELTPTTPIKNGGFFRADFPVKMMRCFLPLLRKTTENPEAEFLNHENLTAIYERYLLEKTK